MSKAFLYKDRFFIEDDDTYSPDYFSASISREVFENGADHWAQLDMGGVCQSAVGWGFNLDRKDDRQSALNHFYKLHLGISEFYQKLEEVCKTLDEKEEKNVSESK